MKKLIIPIVIVALILAAGFFFLQPKSGATSAAAPTPLAPVKSSDRVVAQGRVLPVHYAELGMAQSGIIAEVLVAPGDAVRAGQALVRLDGARQQAAVSQAEAEVKVAQAQLARVKAGATAAEIAAAQAQVAAAQAEYARLKTGARQESVAAAQAAVKSAQANYEAAVQAAGSNSAQITAAQAGVNRAKAAMDRAQAAYDRVSGRNDVGMLPQSLALQTATIDYQQAKATLDALTRTAGPDAESRIQAAASSVAQAQANLATVNPTPEDLQAAQAKVDQAQAAYAKLKDGARVEDIAVAQADVDRATASLQAARSAARDLELRAPFDGTVAWMDATVGESVSAGVLVARIADLSAWRVQTEDLNETGLGQIQNGSTTVLKFDAVPGLVLNGTVERIELVGEKKQGDMTYAVIVKPEQNDNRLRWNMTASVEIKSVK